MPAAGSLGARGKLACVARVMVVFAGAVLVCLCLCSAAVAAGDVNHSGVCVQAELSAGFREYLPDCRAYELVTPSVSGNAPVVQPVRISVNGERFIAGMSGSLTGAEDREPGAQTAGTAYEFSRTPAGWSAEALNLPATEFPRQDFNLASADLSRTLWIAETAAQPGEELADPFSRPSMLVLREASGTGGAHFSVVGPTASPFRESLAEEEEGVQPGVADASADLTHILIEVPVKGHRTWPGDETLEHHNSLYEYREAGREPVLVGVRNRGPLHGAGHVNVGAQLISQCGTELGSTEEHGEHGIDHGTTYNALSADGEAVYFTAYAHSESCEEGVAPPVNELYVRVAGSATLDVSEPPLSGPEAVPGRECTEACAEDESEHRGAGFFEGASSDGTKVFFLSPQRLVDGPALPGSYLYEETFALEGEHSHATSLKLIAGEVSSVARIAEYGTRVYFQSEGELTKAANANGETAEEGHENLYVYDGETGRVAFVAREASPLGSRSPFGATADGGFLVFESARQLEGTNDTSSVAVPQIFEYDAETGGVARVSVGQHTPGVLYECPATGISEAGFACDGNTTNEEDAPGLLEQRNESGHTQPYLAASSNLTVSEAGAVVFTSRLALTPQALQGVETPGGVTENVYEYTDGNVYLLSPSDEPAPFNGGRSRLRGIDASGEDVFFETTDGLVPQDVDSQVSWYDARVQGGFPAPSALVECQGSACRAGRPTPPSLSPPLAPPAANENLATPSAVPPLAPKPAAKPKAKGCKKGFLKRKERCVRARAKKSAIARANRGPRS